MSAPRTAAGDVLTDLVLEVFRLNGRLLAAGDRLARPAGQTSARWQVLGALEARAATASEIARAMGLTRQSVQRTADRLTAAGLLASAPHPEHRRARPLRLTPRGHAVLAAIGRRQRAWADRLGGRLGPGTLRQAVAALRQFREALEGEASGPRAGGGRVSRSRRPVGAAAGRASAR